MRLLRCSITAVLLSFCNPAFAEQEIHPDEALQHLHWEDAHHAIGKVAFISGKIVDVGKGGHISFLNFDTERPPAFVAVVFGDDFANFKKPLKETYLNKIVRVRGMVSTYRGKPQIAVKRPEQIEILDKLPETTLPVDHQRPKSVEGELIVATYNVLNLFDSEDDPYHNDETTPSKPREQMQHLAQSIVKLNADVIALQEVENRGYLQRFVDVFLPDMGYKHIVHYEGNDLRGIDVCLLSRIPIGPVRSHRHLRFSGPDGSRRGFSRDLLAVTIEPPDAEALELWVVHLKSNSGGREHAEPIRLAEAGQIRKMLDAQLSNNPDARIIVLGDFNDTWDSKTLTTIVGTGPREMWSASRSLGDEMPDTFNRGDHRSMIDFILCTPSMVKTFVADSFQVIPGSPESTGSDHNPVAASFRME